MSETKEKLRELLKKMKKENPKFMEAIPDIEDAVKSMEGLMKRKDRILSNIDIGITLIKASDLITEAYEERNGDKKILKPSTETLLSIIIAILMAMEDNKSITINVKK